MGASQSMGSTATAMGKMSIAEKPKKSAEQSEREEQKKLNAMKPSVKAAYLTKKRLAKVNSMLSKLTAEKERLEKPLPDMSEEDAVFELEQSKPKEVGWWRVLQAESGDESETEWLDAFRPM